jgi:hypothetical protein
LKDKNKKNKNKNKSNGKKIYESAWVKHKSRDHENHEILEQIQ